ncbi:PAS domain-containing protein [uncultured Shimia sp.]|uniref:PAS domain-containing protein n=1 Tax=uncultured Shimia sp. TaxID=573152 RepID=UPI00260882A8|nr:PAS domain-containing protein [uncultured Shimia sp.]
MRFLDGGYGRKTGRPHGAVLREIESYWDALRDGRDMPMRLEVDPRGIEQALRHAFILERMAQGLARIRIAGGLFKEIMGMDTHGMPVSSLIGISSRDGFRDVLESVFSGPARARLSLSAERGIGRPALTGEMILLPLRSSKGDVTRVLGGLEIDRQIGGSPRRFGLTSSFQRTLRDVHAMTPSDPASARKGPPASLPRTVSTGVPHLRLVVNDT